MIQENPAKSGTREVFDQQYMKPLRRQEDYGKWDCRYGSGRGIVTAYYLWPGVVVFRNDFEMEQFPSQILEEYHLLKINYCLEGRCEVCLRNHRYVYLQPGTVDVDINQEGAMFFFPGERYLGLEYVIDLLKIPQEVHHMLQDFGIRLRDEYESLKAVGGSRLGPPAQETRALLEEAAGLLQNPPGEGLLQRLRLVTVHILADLCRDGKYLHQERAFYLTKQQRQMVLDVYREIREEDQDVRVETLAQKHQTSASSLEHYFKAMYGESIYRYRKRLRIQKAKDLLQTHGEMAIGEIALRCGYSHPGKFSAAFLQEVGVSPREFRRK